MTITISIPNIVINISNTNSNLEQMAHTLDELLQLATEQSTKEDSLLEILNGFKKQIADAIANAGSGADAAEIQAQVDAVFEKFTANTQKLADAITANTPDAGTQAPTDGGVTVPVDETPVDTVPVDGTDGSSVPPADGGGTSTDPVPVDGTPAPTDGPTAPGEVPAPAQPGTPVTNPDGSTVI